MTSILTLTVLIQECEIGLMSITFWRNSKKYVDITNLIMASVMTPNIAWYFVFMKLVASYYNLLWY